MKCKQCGHRYPANQFASWPGGWDPPGCFFYIGAVLVLATVVLFQLDFRFWRWVGLALSLTFAYQTYVAWICCRSHGNFGAKDDTGGTCPGCKHQNKVRPWSF